MKRATRDELTSIRKGLVVEYHRLSAVLCADNLETDLERQVREAFEKTDEAICAINKPLGIQP